MAINQNMTCFVIMPHADEFDPVYAAIGDALNRIQRGIDSVRAKDLRREGGIYADMTAAITGSRICIADISGLNPNVLWEVGYAMASKRPTLLITQDPIDPPFNISGQRIFRYALPQGLSHLSADLELAIRDTLERLSPPEENVAVNTDLPSDASLAPKKKTVGRRFAAAFGVALAALAVLYALRSGFETPVIPAAVTENASGRCGLIHVARDQRRVQVMDGVYVQLHHIETLQGNAEGDSLTGHEFNKKYLDKDGIFERALKAVGIPDTVASDMRNNDQKWWDTFRAGDEKRKRLTSLPLVQLSIFRGRETLVDAKYFLEGERLPEIWRSGLPAIVLELEDAYNTKRSSDESIALRLVTEKPPQSST
jgi:hypothetical protein